MPSDVCEPGSEARLRTDVSRKAAKTAKEEIETLFLQLSGRDRNARSGGILFLNGY